MKEIDYTVLPIGAQRKIRGQQRMVVKCPKCDKPGLVSQPYKAHGRELQFVTHGEKSTGFAVFVDSCTIKIWAGEEPIRWSLG